MKIVDRAVRGVRVGMATATIEGGCRFARAGACTCFQPKGERWHRAHQAWLERHERERENEPVTTTADDDVPF